MLKAIFQIIVIVLIRLGVYDDCAVELSGKRKLGIRFQWLCRWFIRGCGVIREPLRIEEMDVRVNQCHRRIVYRVLQAVI